MRLPSGDPSPLPHTTRITGRQWLSHDTFTLNLERPPGFCFVAGQRIGILVGPHERDYSLIPGKTPEGLELLVRSVPGGFVSSHLSTCPLEDPVKFTGPSGHFIHRPSTRAAVLVATGTGVAPFAAMCRSGLRGFVMLHGGHASRDLHYRKLVESAAALYVPCLSGPSSSSPEGTFSGRVTRYLQSRLDAGEYDFYLAGRREMVADVVAIVDARFPSSRVYSEIFF